MRTESLNHHHQANDQPIEKMIIGKLEGKLVAAKILLNQGMAW